MKYILVSSFWFFLLAKAIYSVFSSFGYELTNFTLQQLINDEILFAITSSGFRWCSGWLIGSMLGVVVGLIGSMPLVPWKTTEKLCSYWSSHHALLHFLRAVPIVALPAMVIFFAGINELGKIFIIVWGAFFPVWLNTYRSTKLIDKELFYIAKGLNSSTKIVIIQIILPSIANSIVSGIRLGLSSAWICVVASEMLGIIEGSTFGNGLGYLLWKHQELGNVDVVFVIMCIFGLIGLVTDFIVVGILKLAFRYRSLQENEQFR